MHVNITWTPRTNFIVIIWDVSAQNMGIVWVIHTLCRQHI